MKWAVRATRFGKVSKVCCGRILLRLRRSTQIEDLYFNAPTQMPATGTNLT